jgi:hypothetical protein
LRVVGGDSITRRWIRWLAKGGKKIPPAVEERFSADLPQFAQRIREELAFFYEDCKPPMSRFATTIITKLLIDTSNIAAVHAYRAAVKNKLLGGKGVSETNMVQSDRLLEWLKNKWINVNDVDENIGRIHIRVLLLSLLMNKSMSKIAVPIRLRRGTPKNFRVDSIM